MLNQRRHPARGADAFTLIELLVVIVIVAVLAAIILPLLGRTKQQADVVKTLSNMRQIGVALLSYANDNDYQLPNRVVNPGGGATTPPRWPTLLQPYLQDPTVYTSPIPDVGGVSYKVVPPNTVFDNSTNRTSYIYNGMNDRGALTDSTVTVRMNTIDQPSQTILLGIPLPQQGQYYMDFQEGAGNNNDVLNKQAFPTGSVYMFCDGSSRLLANTKDPSVNLQKPVNSGTYTDWLWLIDKGSTSIIQQGH